MMTLRLTLPLFALSLLACGGSGGSTGGDAAPPVADGRSGGAGGGDAAAPGGAGGSPDGSTPEADGTSPELDASTPEDDARPEPDAAPAPDVGDKPDAGPEPDAAPVCTPATEGCPCANGACGFTDDGAELECLEDTCQRRECLPATEGCPCAGGACGFADDGAELQCSGGFCGRVDCPAGASGCACRGDACDAADEICSGGTCQPDACPAGSSGCPCRGLICDDGDFECSGGRCVPVDEPPPEDPCPPGTLGCACGDEQACGAGLSCRGDLCMPCQPGSLGCDCDFGVCYAGLACNGARCVSPEDADPPALARCYTPCQDSLVDANGRFIECDTDKLMAGCWLGGRECREGSCLLPDEPVPACDSDAACASHQTCLQGRCYSTCVARGDCGDDAVCHRKVCRRACDVREARCPDGSACESTDGVSGVCTPVAPTDEAAPPRPEEGHLELSRLAVELTNVVDEGGFAVRNESPVARTITVRKLNETLVDAQGRVTRRRHADPAEPCDLQQTCPLAWLDLGPQFASRRQQSFDVRIPPGEQISVELGNAAGSPGVRWQGALEVTSPGLSATRIELSYTQTPDGQWAGTMYHFGTFDDHGLEAWSRLPHDTRDTAQSLQGLSNAFIKQWSSFRRPRMSHDEFQAVLTSIRTESWSFPAVKEACARLHGPSAACYLWPGGQDGLGVLTTDFPQNPVPAGVVELPIAMNLRGDPGDPLALTGRIESTVALQYAGDPAVSLRFAVAPTECSRSPNGACLTFFDVAAGATPFARVQVGGRYESGPDDGACLPGFDLVTLPWLPTGFERNTGRDAAFGRVRSECRSRALPSGDPADVAHNVRLAASNPIPDGRARRRNLFLVDGALMNQNTLFLIFKEQFESFLGESDAAGFSGYGFMVLTREAGPLPTADDDGDGTPDAFEGAVPPANPQEAPPGRLAAVACDPEILAELNVAALTPQTANAATEKLVLGGTRSGAVQACAQIAPTPQRPQPCLDPGETVHALCEDTGTLVDGTQAHTQCPFTSKIEYFTLTGNRDADIAECNEEGTCVEMLSRWQASGALVQYGPAWRCRDAQQRLCDDDRFDLVSSKIFFRPADPEVVAPPLAAEIDQAFRYKTRFRNRDGTNLGFAPVPCVPGSERVPYCYDAPQIEHIRGRVDCLAHVWGDANLFGALTAENRLLLKNTLTESFSLGPVPRAVNLDPAALVDGFERLYAELLVMQADEAITAAFASRYQLEGRPAAFPGATFEDGGLDLSGTVGAEFRSLYLALQLYDEALQRFYSLAPTIWQSIEGEAGRNFVTADMVTAYIERVLRASTQKARATSAIAERYQGIGRSDLARQVIERAFTGAYLESVVMSRMMSGLTDSVLAAVPREAREGIRLFAADAHRRYQAAMVDMRSRFQAIQENVNVFGFAPDFVPFPTVDVRESNAFENVLARAQTKARAARDREEAAIASDRAFDTDSAQFQSELVRLRTTYEAQLGDVCGTFVADGVVYPAIKRYAHLHPDLVNVGDPCGYVGNGEIFNAVANTEINGIEIRRVLQQMETARGEMAIEFRALVAECGVPGADCPDVTDPNGPLDCRTLDKVRSFGDRRLSMQDSIRDKQFFINRLQGAMAGAEKVLQYTVQAFSCGGDAAIRCAIANGAAAVAVGLAQAGVEIGVSLLELEIAEKQHDLEALQIEEGEWNVERECASLTINRNAAIERIELRLAELELDGLRAEYQLRLGLSEMRRLRQKGMRLQQEQAEAEQLAIDLEAARNDPNVRLYRNDAVINAEVSFDQALREAYRATLVFEYYTSQSYAQRGDLYLVRLVSRGEYNLENYLAELDDAFIDFEQSFGLPDTRVLKLSLRDDILNIPTAGPGGETLSGETRIGMLREKLREPAFLDERGYLSIPFDTRIEQVSPVTRDHKILYVEAELNVNDGGDSVARLYLQHGGTSSVAAIGGERRYYRLPEVTAVLNPYFSGAKGIFAPDVYSNRRLRDRPLISTGWRLILNQRDELANRDIDLASVNDITLFLYYADFTEF